ncbi:PAS domain-containing protein [Methylobacterium sp. A54F]
MLANAIERGSPSTVDLGAALSASGVVGTWSWSARPDRCILDAGAADILAGDHALAGRPLTLEVAKARVCPEDQPDLFRHFRQLRRTGGLFVAEYRTVSATGERRRILDRGRLYPAQPGQPAHGHGIIIDLTESTQDTAAFVATEVPAAESPLDAAAAHAIACREVIAQLGNSELRLLADMLLLRLGQELARTQSAREGLH